MVSAALENRKYRKTQWHIKKKRRANENISQMGMSGMAGENVHQRGAPRGNSRKSSGWLENLAALAIIKRAMLSLRRFH